MNSILQRKILFNATRACSPHNAQGWNLKFLDNKIQLSLDPERQVMGAFDSSHKEGVIGLGAMAANIMLTLNSLNFSSDVIRVRDDLYEITYQPQSDIHKSNLFPLIAKRSTNRNPYYLKPIDHDLIKALNKTAKSLGVQLSLVTDPKMISLVADLSEKTARIKLKNKETLKELSHFFRYSRRSVSQQSDGLDLKLFSQPQFLITLSQYLFLPQVFSLLDVFGFSKFIAYQNEKYLMKRSPGLILLSAKQTSHFDYFKVGRVFQTMALEACARNYSIQPHSSAVEINLNQGRSDFGAFIEKQLKTIFQLDSDETPMMLMRIGEPKKIGTSFSQRRSLDRLFDIENSDYDEMTMRNQPVISSQAQKKIRELRVLVAGCGSIGGAVVEPLVRLGVEKFLLAEPGEYELNNLNRQSATQKDIGRNKAQVLKERILSINPKAVVDVYDSGIQEDNVDETVATVDFLFDGIDVTEGHGLKAKALLHEKSVQYMKPVVIGLDIGSSQIVYGYNYHSKVMQAFNGKINLSNEMDSVNFLNGLIAVRDIPLSFMKYCYSYVMGTAGPAPQLVPIATQYGSIACWQLIRFCEGLNLTEKIKIDLNELSESFFERHVKNCLKIYFGFLIKMHVLRKNRAMKKPLKTQGPTQITS